jgi:2-haloacid dehalogenase
VSAAPPLDPARVTALTLDCYGTLIDWEAGAVGALRPLLARHGVALPDDELVRAFQDLDEELCAPPYRPYRAVLAGVVEGLGRRFGFPVGPAERDLLAASLPSWEPFPDTVEALRALGRRFRLAVVSNVDDDLFDATARRLGVRFDHVVTSEQVRSHKPRPPIFEEAIRRLGAAPGAVAHVAEGASEIPLARRLGCATVWVRRRGRSARHLTQAPDLEVPDLRSLLVRTGADG